MPAKSAAKKQSPTTQPKSLGIRPASHENEYPSSDPALPLSTTDDERPSQNVQNKRMVKVEADGILPDGTRFKMPATISVMRSLIIPRCYTLVSTQLWIFLCLLTNPLSLYFYYAYGPTDSVMAFYTIQFVFWRLAYNAGIGGLLHIQSNGKRFETWVEKWFINSRIGRGFLERSVTFRDASVKPFKVSDYPKPFCAWMLFRFIVNVILACDLLSYFVLVYVHWHPPMFIDVSTGALNIVDVSLYAVGLGLILFAIWSKSDAHRVIGDYAWYWGDFFFLLDQELTFDGIFEMFPHPMYTVGYAFMYGFALMAKSHTVFYWSVFGHVCQMVFLTLVENPHIDKTYNSAYMPSDDEMRREAILYDDEKGYFEKKELVVLKNFKWYRASDLVVLLCLAYSTVTWLLARSISTPVTLLSPETSDAWPIRGLTSIMNAFQQPGAWTVVGQYLLWRFALLFGLGLRGLRQQSLQQRYTQDFGSARRAFDSWKVLYNTTVTTTNYCFILCVIQFGDWSSLFTASVAEWRLTMGVIGALLVGINAWATLGVYEAVGDYGYFYGDFFINDVPSKLAYSGVYRYLNNPDSVLGCAWFYGLALVAASPAVALLAVVSHACVKAFEVFVEAPHMRRKYGTLIRKEGGARRAIKERTKSVRVAIEERRRRARVDYERALARFTQELQRRKEAYERLITSPMQSPSRQRGNTSESNEVPPMELPDQQVTGRRPNSETQAGPKRRRSAKAE